MNYLLMPGSAIAPVLVEQATGSSHVTYIRTMEYKHIEKLQAHSWLTHVQTWDKC